MRCETCAARIFQTPGANALEVGNEVRAKMAALAAEFPQGLTYDIPFDTTKFVNASIFEVYKTLIEAAVLVLVVILFFLQDWRATLVPATTAMSCVPAVALAGIATVAAVNAPVLSVTVLLETSVVSK